MFMLSDMTLLVIVRRSAGKNLERSLSSLISNVLHSFSFDFVLLYVLNPEGDSIPI